MEYNKEDIFSYVLSERAKTWMLSQENHVNICNRYSNYLKTVRSITIQVKQDIADSLKRIVSILHHYQGASITDKDMYLIFPKDFSEELVLMRKRDTYLPQEYCEVRFISLQGYDGDDPIIHFSGEIYNHSSSAEYVAGANKEQNMGSIELIDYPETDLESYLSISYLLRSLIDPYVRYSRRYEQWGALFDSNRSRFSRN